MITHIYHFSPVPHPINLALDQNGQLLLKSEFSNLGIDNTQIISTIYQLPLMKIYDFLKIPVKYARILMKLRYLIIKQQKIELFR